MVTPLTSSNGNGTHPQVVQQLRPLPPPGTDPALSRYLDHMWDSVYQLLDLHVQNRSAIESNAPPTMQEIEKALEAQGSNPLNVTALRGQLGESQIAGAPSLSSLPALSDQSYDDGALVAVSSVVYRRNRATDPGSWDAVTVSGSSGANPSASVGLAAVNGIAITFMRSDGAPALSQGISPTWTAVHQFNSRIGIGVAPDTSSALRIDSTTGAFLPPRMTAAQRDALTAIDGMIIYNTDSGALNYRKAGVWTAI